MAVDDVILRWTERHLKKQPPSPAWEVDDLVHRAIGILASGRSLMVLGPSGTGKTALIHELVRRSMAGERIPGLEGRRVVQISIRGHLAGLRKPKELGAEFRALVDALIAKRGEVVPFIRDAGQIYRYDLEPNLRALCDGLPCPVLAEGLESAVRSMLEYQPDLVEAFVPLVVEEPDVAKVGRIVARWSEADPRTFTEGAQETAIALCHRFLARDAFPRKALTLLDNAGALNPDDPVDEPTVIEHFCGIHRVPRHLVDPEIRPDLGEVERHFRGRLHGQVEAVQAVTHMIALIKAGLSDVRRPFGVFLFVGPTGVGKTHLAQLLATYLFGNRDRLVRLNMADHQTEQDALVLFGNPDAHPLSIRRGTLTQRVSGHPFAVLLFDELEKAHATVIDRFLQLMDEGSFINGANETVSCRSTIVIATSNAGAEVYGGRLVGFGGTPMPDEIETRVDRAIQTQFRVEFLNRFDRVVRFRPLQRSHIRAIARGELELLARRPGLTRTGVHLEVDESVLDWLTAHGYDPRYGARFLRRTVEREVTTVVAHALVRDRLEAGDRVHLVVHGGRVVARVEARPKKPEVHTVEIPHLDGEERVKLDAAGLRREATELLARAAPLLAEVDRSTTDRTALLGRINADGFWEDPEREAVLSAYRDLDVRVEGEVRSARPLRRLAELLDGPVADARLAEALQHAARALDAWEARVAENSADHVVLVLTQQDALNDAGPFLQDLLAIEEAWCRRAGLETIRVAVQQRAERVECIVVDVRGAGAEAALAAEVGVHRVHRAGEPDGKVGVAVLPVGPGNPDALDTTWRKKRRGPFDLPVRCEVRVELPGAGVHAVFQAADDELARECLAVAAESWDALRPTEVARRYAFDGVGGRDPRTGAAVRRFKDLKKGQLGVFVEAWRALNR